MKEHFFRYFSNAKKEKKGYEAGPGALHHLNKYFPKNCTMERLFALVIVLLSSLNVHSQDLQPGLIAASGGSGISEAGSLSWSVGELAVLTFSSPNAQLSQGFHQNGLQITPVIEMDGQSIQMDVFPNPTTQVLQIRTTGASAPLRYQIFSLLGRPIQAGQHEGTTSLIDLEHLPAQTYILKLFGAFGKEVAVFKIQKID